MDKVTAPAPRMSRRSFLRGTSWIAGSAALSGTVSSCHNGLLKPSSSTSNGVHGSTVTITYWDWWVTQAVWVDDEIKRFEQAHPHIKIAKVTNAVNIYGNLLNLSAQSNKLPDVFMVSTQPTLSEQVKHGWLKNLDAYAGVSWRSRFPAHSFIEGNNELGGHLYTAPLAGNAPTYQLYINNKVFRAAGLTNPDGSVLLPHTWDDVTHAAETITQKGHGNVYGLGFGNGSFGLLPWWLDLFVRAAGSPAGSSGLDYRTGKYTYATDRNYGDCIALLMEWKRKGFIYPDAMSIGDEAARALFEQGKFGMTVGGVWNQSEWNSHHFTDYSLVTLLGPQETPLAYFYHSGGGSFVGISAKSAFAPEAWQWFDWLYSPEAGKRFVEKGIDLSIYPQNNDPHAITLAPFAQYVATSSKMLLGPDPGVRNPQTAQVGLLMKTVKPDISDTLVGIYTGQIQDVQSALSSLASNSQQSLDDAIKQAQQQGYKVSQADYVFSDWDPLKPYTGSSAHVYA